MGRNAAEHKRGLHPHPERVAQRAGEEDALLTQHREGREDDLAIARRVAEADDLVATVADLGHLLLQVPVHHGVGLSTETTWGNLR